MNFDTVLQQLLSENDRLRHENSVLTQRQWAKRGDQRTTSYFILVDTKYKPTDAADQAWAIAKCHEIMRQFAADLATLVTFNKKGHTWSPTYIKDVRVKYCVEVGKGKLKKDGTRGKVGGTVHIHIYVVIKHVSNITISHDSTVDFFQPLVQEIFGTERVFVGGPRLVSENMVEKYMYKDIQKPQWTEVSI